MSFATQRAVRTAKRRTCFLEVVKSCPLVRAGARKCARVRAVISFDKTHFGSDLDRCAQADEEGTDSAPRTLEGSELAAARNTCGRRRSDVPTCEVTYQVHHFSPRRGLCGRQNLAHVFGGKFRVYAVACNCMQIRATTGETVSGQNGVWTTNQHQWTRRSRQRSADGCGALGTARATLDDRFALHHFVRRIERGADDKTSHMFLSPPVRLHTGACICMH